MKAAFLVCSGALFIAVIGCSPAADSPQGSGGRPGSGGSSSSTGGTTAPGTGGTSSSGGTTGSGGAGTGTGGAADSGGSNGTGTGGSGPASGGTTGNTGGSGPSSGGTMGTGTGGTVVSTGGAGPVGTGGAGTGGVGGGGVVGTGGAVGTGGSSTGPTVAQVAGDLDGFLFLAPCGDSGTGFDCTNAGCSSGSPKTVTRTFMLGGTPGTMYNMTFNVRGIVEAKNYSGTTRRAGSTMTYNDSGDFWATGGTIPMSSYNTYEMHVLPRVTGEPNDYYLNARNGTSEGHESWKLGYTATIKVPGGGMINWRVFDSNCRQIMNCGVGVGSNSTGCRAPGTVPLGNPMPAPPASFVQPFVGTAPGGARGQWVFIDVTAVTVAQ